jgi:hypothetical protein
LRKRARTPAKGRGSVQRAIKRAFAATSASALTSTQIYDWAHVRCRLGRRTSMPFGVYSRTLRTLRAMRDAAAWRVAVDCARLSTAELGCAPIGEDPKTFVELGGLRRLETEAATEAIKRVREAAYPLL